MGLSRLFCSLFSVFMFSMPYRVIIIVIQFMFLGIKFYVLDPSQSYFRSCLVPQAKMTLSLAKNIFLPTNTNYIDSKYHNV